MNSPKIERVYLAPGIRVTWTYEHSLNRHSRVMRTLHGTVVRTIKHRNRFYKQQVAVVFDGNKGESIVHMDQLDLEKS